MLCGICCVDAPSDGCAGTMLGKVVKLEVIACSKCGGGSQLSIPCIRGNTKC